MEIDFFLMMKKTGFHTLKVNCQELTGTVGNCQDSGTVANSRKLSGIVGNCREQAPSHTNFR